MRKRQVAISGIQQLRGSESFINTNPQEGDVEDYARVGTNLERRIVDFVLHLGSDVGSLAMQVRLVLGSIILVGTGRKVDRAESLRR